MPLETAGTAPAATETPHGTTVGEAAKRIAEARTKPPETEQAESTPTDSTATDTGDSDTPPPGEGDTDTDDGDGTGTPPEGDEADSGDGSEPPQKADLVSSLKALPPAELARKFVLPIGPDGALEEVPMSELLRGHLRERDYTLKTMALANEAKVLTAERAQYAAVLPVFLERLKANAPKQRTEQEWQELWDTDPLTAAREVHNVQQYERLVQASEQEQQRVAQAQQQEFLRELETRAMDEAKKLKTRLAKELDTPEKIGKFRAEVTGYLKSEYGLTDTDIAGIHDHRAFILAHKARAYDMMQKARATVPSKQSNVPQRAPVKPGVPAPIGAVARTAEKRAGAELKKTGSIKAAGALIAARRRGTARR